MKLSHRLILAATCWCRSGSVSTSSQKFRTPSPNTAAKSVVHTTLTFRPFRATKDCNSGMREAAVNIPDLRSISHATHPGFGGSRVNYGTSGRIKVLRGTPKRFLRLHVRGDPCPKRKIAVPLSLSSVSSLMSSHFRATSRTHCVSQSMAGEPRSSRCATKLDVFGVHADLYVNPGGDRRVHCESCRQLTPGLCSRSRKIARPTMASLHLDHPEMPMLCAHE